MRVDVGGGGVAGMAKQRLQHLHVNAGGDGGGGHAVPEAMQVDRPQAGRGDVARKREIEPVRVDWPVVDP